DVPPGFVNPGQVLTMRITIPQAVIEDAMQSARAHQQIVHNIEAVPGVQSVGVSSSITMDGNTSMDPVDFEDFPAPKGKIAALRRYKQIGAGYFETMGNPIVAGRGITWSDVDNMNPVVMISENLAREYWKDDITSALGKRVRQNDSTPWREIIGIVGNDRQDGATKPAPATIYWPMAIKDFWGNENYVQRTLGYAIRSSRLQDPSFLKEVQ